MYVYVITAFLFVDLSTLYCLHIYSVLEEQTKSVVRSLHGEAMLFYEATKQIRESRNVVHEAATGVLRAIIHGLWTFADIKPFGSHATGLSSTSRYSYWNKFFISMSCDYIGLLKFISATWIWLFAFATSTNHYHPLQA